MSIAVWTVLLLVSLWTFLYSLWMCLSFRRRGANAGWNVDFARETDDELTLEAVNASIVRTRATCSSKSCTNLDEDGLCKCACVAIGADGKCMMMKKKEN